MIQFHDILTALFNELNINNVSYCVIRNYSSVQEVNKADDLDISISGEDKKNTVNIFCKLGWMTPAINYNKYGHQQFYKWDRKRLYKVDVIWDLSFANGKYILNDNICIYHNPNYIQEAKIPNDQIGLKILFLHVLLDKREMSITNHNNLKRLLSKLNNDKFSDIVEKVIDGVFERNKRDEIIASLLQEKVIIKNSKLAVIKHRASNFIKRIQLFFQKKKYKIAIIGLDGTGKSTVVKALGNYYQEKSVTQYFGFRDYETRLALRRFNGNYYKIPILSPIKTAIVLYLEMLSRYHRVMSAKAKLKIFDRYVWESYDNEERIDARIIYKLLFKFFFPDVDATIYLYCPAEISLSRKDDIEDVNAFLKMKQCIDNIYLKKDKVITIDTNSHPPQEVTGLIVSYIFKITKGNYN